MIRSPGSISNAQFDDAFGSLHRTTYYPAGCTLGNQRGSDQENAITDGKTDRAINSRVDKYDRVNLLILVNEINMR